MRIISLIIKIISCFVLVASWVFIISNFGNLPNSIPTHYGWDGNPDHYSSRNTIWITLVIQTILFFTLLYYSKNPTKPGLNIPKNLKQNKVVAEIVVSSLLFIIMLLLGTISCASIITSLENLQKISLVISCILGLLFVWFIGIFLLSSKISKQQKQIL